MKKTYLYAAMEKIDEDIEELEIGSVRDEEAHVEQERLIVLPEVLPHDSHDSHALHCWLAGSHFVKTPMSACAITYK